MKKILLFCHNIQRDKQFDSMLEHELEKDNMVWLTKMLAHDFRNICLIKPDVVVLPEIRNEYTLEIARRIKEWGGQIVVRHGEMGITEESISSGFNPDYKKAIFGNVDFNEHVDLVLVFGTQQVEQMVKYRGVDREKIRVIGNPILDPYFTPEEPGVKKSEQKTILFATGFPYADRNPNYVMPEAPVGADIHKYFKQLCSRKRSEWVKLIKWFLQEYPEWKVRIRPHSGERLEVYQTLFKDKVEYVCGPPSRMTLRENDCIVHAASTCSFEVHLLGVPGIIYSPITHDVLLKELHPAAENIDQFKKIFNSLKPGESNINKSTYKAFEDKYIGPVDGKVHCRAAKYINSLPDVEKNVIPDKWPQIKEPMKDIDPDIALYGEMWNCGGCNNKYFVLNHREMVKCPFCGIANVRIAGNVQRQVNPVCGSSKGEKQGSAKKEPS